jgi:hypothetical protein
VIVLAGRGGRVGETRKGGFAGGVGVARGGRAGSDGRAGRKGRRVLDTKQNRSKIVPRKPLSEMAF